MGRGGSSRDVLGNGYKLVGAHGGKKGNIDAAAGAVHLILFVVALLVMFAIVDVLLVTLAVML